MAVHIDKEKMVQLPSPPFVSVPGIHNFRDLGGYTVSPGFSVRRKVIYRCGEPSKVTQDGIEMLKSLGITHMYDLRSKVEIDGNKGAGWGSIREWDGCERVFAPVFIDQDYSPENLAIRFKDYASEGTEVMKPFIGYELQGLLIYLCNRVSQGLIPIYLILRRRRTEKSCYTWQTSLRNP
jgi:hypothetical protein